mgnify:CR=1 FL=1
MHIFLKSSIKVLSKVLRGLKGFFNCFPGKKVIWAKILPNLQIFFNQSRKRLGEMELNFVNYTFYAYNENEAEKGLKIKELLRIMVNDHGLLGTNTEFSNKDLGN